MAFDVIFRAWIALVSGLVAGGWILSLFERLRWMEYVGPLVLVAICIWMALCLRALPRTEWSGLREYFLFWPFLLLFALILTAAVIYPPTVFDSLAYRLPRLLLWWQEGRVAHFPVADDRLNYLAHNWELVAMPVFLRLGEASAEWQNVVTWLLLYGVCIQFARKFCPNEALRRWIAISGVAGYFPLLQAARTSNDLFPVLFVMLAVWFFLQAREAVSVPDLLWSGLSLALAAGTKPHFAVLGLFWLVAFIFSFPWRGRLRRVILVGLVALPMALLVSPLPGLLLNKASYGSVMGPLQDGDDMVSGSVGEKVLAGTTMSLWGNLQPPVNPLAGRWNAWFSEASRDWSLRTKLKKFNLPAHEVPVVDGAGLGFFVSALWLCGIGLAVMRRHKMPRAVWFIAGCGLASFAIASSMVTATTIARSFMAIVYLCFPLAAAGLGCGERKWAKTWAAVGVLAGAMALILTPSNPLWPVRTVEAWLSANRPGSPAAQMVERYASFTDRYSAGRELVASVAPGSSVLAVMGGGEPLVQLWSSAATVKFLRPGADIDEEILRNYHYVLVGGIADQLHKETLRKLESSRGLVKEVGRRNYISRLQDGPRDWVLYEVLNVRPARGNSDAVEPDVGEEEGGHGGRREERPET